MVRMGWRSSEEPLCRARKSFRVASKSFRACLPQVPSACRRGPHRLPDCTAHGPQPQHRQPSARGPAPGAPHGRGVRTGEALPGGRWRSLRCQFVCFGRPERVPWRRGGQVQARSSGVQATFSGVDDVRPCRRRSEPLMGPTVARMRPGWRHQPGHLPPLAPRAWVA